MPKPNLKQNCKPKKQYATCAEALSWMVVLQGITASLLFLKFLVLFLNFFCSHFLLWLCMHRQVDGITCNTSDEPPRRTKPSKRYESPPILAFLAFLKQLSKKSLSRASRWFCFTNKIRSALSKYWLKFRVCALFLCQAISIFFVWHHLSLGNRSATLSTRVARTWHWW